jgi:hypothetical protein
MTNAPQPWWQKLDQLKSRRPSSLLGLTLDGSRLAGVVLQRTNGSLTLQQSFNATLTLDPLTNDPALVGREIRNHLDAAGVRERHCVVGAPLTWALTVHSKVPELPEADLASFLQLEAERGFPCDVATLLVGKSLYRSASGEQMATLVGVPLSHLDRLEQVLRGAQLKPLSLALGLAALQPAGVATSEGVLAMTLGESCVGLQITSGGGVAALRSLEGVFETDGGQRVLQSDQVARDTRITLGQLPEEVRDTVRRIRIFGPREPAQELAGHLERRLAAMSLQVELVSDYAPGEFGVQLPAGAAVSEAFSMAAARLTNRLPVFELLPPKVTAWQALAAKYSSGKLQRAGVAAAAVLLIVVGAFLVQQWQLMRLRSQWADLGPKAREVEALEAQVRQFRPWFDESFRTLSIMRALTTAFPEDGVVSAKNIEIRDPATVSCSGIARDNQSWLKMYERLRSTSGVTDLKVDVIRGKSPIQFTFDFHWVEGSKP